MNNRFLANIFTKVLSAFVLVIAGCTTPAMNGNQQEAAVVAPVFPPGDVMQSGNYTMFLKVNEAALRECKDNDQCAIALFNLGFVYVYPSSPYYKLGTALQFFEELSNKYPQTPWAQLAKAWIELVKKNMAAESGRYRLRSQLKSKEMIIKELQQQLDLVKEVDMEADKKGKELQKLIERSRQIDMEMDRKERELLQ